jgi:hypothetical protein
MGIVNDKEQDMNERIREFARQTGLCDADGDFFGGKISQYDEFAQLIRADEREACAKLCEEIAEDLREEGRPVVAGLRVAAKEIRARGEK